MAKKSTDHIVVNTKENGRFECRHCGATKDPYPINIDNLDSIIAEFTAEHIDCEMEVVNVNVRVSPPIQSIDLSLTIGGEEKEDVEGETEQVCENCDGERVVEGARICGSPSLGGCSDGMCGGCYASEPCMYCGEEDQDEPDWDAMREAREEAAEDRAQDEVDWESPE